MSKKLLVIGATGKQGSAFIQSVFQPPSESSSLPALDDVTILALTRNVSSPSAQALKHLVPEGQAEKLKLVQANLDDAASVEKLFVDEGGVGALWGVLMVLAFPGLGADATGEEKQGKTVADLAVKYQVEHLVYTSSDRGGESYDDNYDLDRAAKVKIERHIKSLEGLKGWTILRPGFFMENFDGAIGSLTVTVLRVGLKNDSKVQLIAANDIGHVAHAVFVQPEAYKSRIISVVGDALTMSEVQESYLKGYGKKMGSVPNWSGKMLLGMNKFTKELISDLERVNSIRASDGEESYENILQTCRSVYPGMLTVEAWAKAKAEEDVKGKGAKGEKKKWNNVSVMDVVRGKV